MTKVICHKVYANQVISIGHEKSPIFYRRCLNLRYDTVIMLILCAHVVSPCKNGRAMVCSCGISLIMR